MHADSLVTIDILKVKPSTFSVSLFLPILSSFHVLSLPSAPCTTELISFLRSVFLSETIFLLNWKRRRTPKTGRATFSHDAHRRHETALHVSPTYAAFKVSLIVPLRISMKGQRCDRNSIGLMVVCVSSSAIDLIAASRGQSRRPSLGFPCLF